MEPPGAQSDADDDKKYSPTFINLRMRLVGCANLYAVNQLESQIVSSARKLSHEENELINKLYCGRVEELRDAVKMRVVSPSEAAVVGVEMDRTKMNKAAVWNALFNRPDYFEILRTEGLAGQLQDGRCRSVAWKLYLGTLPVDKNKWAEAAKKSRDVYADAVKKFVVDPHEVSREDDLVKNNPLSIDDDAPWQQHFKDQEFRKNIQQDIHRTFPDVDFFRSKKVQEDLLNILFCYSRFHPDLGYKQGMHELLAGIYYTLYLDRADPHEKQTAEFTDVMLNILDPEFVPHDAFALFCVVMNVAAAWFQQSKAQSREPSADSHGALFRESRLDDGSAPVMVQLRRIHNIILNKFDPELFALLTRLDISPQIYGLRWIRVLFAREFSLTDTFKVWDAIFADSKHLKLTDYMFVAILCFCRAKYLASDSTQALRLLMSPLDNVQDVQYIIELALHIREPKVYPRPALVGNEDGVSAPPTPRATPKSTPTKSTPTRRSRSPFKGSRGTGAQLQPSTRSITTTTSLPTTPAKSESITTTVQGTRGRKLLQSSNTVSNVKPPQSGVSQPTALTKVNNQLKRELEAMKTTNKELGLKLHAHLNQIQEELLVTDRLPDDDVLFLALAGIKEVKGALEGTINPSLILRKGEKK